MVSLVDAQHKAKWFWTARPKHIKISFTHIQNALTVGNTWVQDAKEYAADVGTNPRLPQPSLILLEVDNLLPTSYELRYWLVLGGNILEVDNLLPTSKTQVLVSSLPAAAV